MQREALLCLKRHRQLVEFFFLQLSKSVWEGGGVMESALSETSTTKTLEKTHQNAPKLGLWQARDLTWIESGRKHAAQNSPCLSHLLIKVLAAGNSVGLLLPSSQLNEPVMQGVIIYHFMVLGRNCHNSA